MGWVQKIMSLFGASYFMFWDSKLNGFRVERAYIRHGQYWRKAIIGSKKVYHPLVKASMAREIPQLVNAAADPATGYASHSVWWTPITKYMKAWYSMLEDEPSLKGNSST